MSEKQKEWEVYEIYLRANEYILPSKLLEFAQKISKRIYEPFSYLNYQKQTVVFARSCYSQVSGFCTRILAARESLLPLTFSCSSTPVIYYSILPPYSFQIGELVYRQDRIARVLSSPGNNAYTVSHPTEDAEAVSQDELQKIHYQFIAVFRSKVKISEVSNHPMHLLSIYKDMDKATISRLPPKE
jgi:hypothetical protein